MGPEKHPGVLVGAEGNSRSTLALTEEGKPDLPVVSCHTEIAFIGRRKFQWRINCVLAFSRIVILPHWVWEGGGKSGMYS